jgi:hypothetical protein
VWRARSSVLHLRRSQVLLFLGGLQRFLGGQAGFEGYLIFGFTEKDLFVLESLVYGNATYVLGSNWESLAGLTKKEILAADLHVARIIHRQGWDSEIARLLAIRA